MMSSEQIKWKEIGLGLGLEMNRLDIIENDLQGTKSRFLEMLSSCLKQGITKDGLVKTLRSELVAIDNEQLVSQIERWNPRPSSMDPTGKIIIIDVQYYVCFFTKFNINCTLQLVMITLITFNKSDWLIGVGYMDA